MRENKYINTQTGEELNLLRFETLADNSMLKVKPELWIEWDFEKNDELGFDIYEATKGIGKKVYWKCSECKSLYDASILNRVNNTNCPYCSGKKVNHTNSLASLKPELAKEWHPTKNGDLTPHEVTSSKNKYAWWLGECGHEWESSINNRNKGTNCPNCTNRKLLVGYNDMWTTNPELALLLANPNDGYRYMQYSGKKVDWKCKDCDGIIKNKTISNTNKEGLCCPNCSNGKSYPERLLYYLLRELGINFECEKVFEWTNKRYDFFIPSHNMIIEVHGLQHYKQTTRNNARTLKEEQENDKFKKEVAKSKGISNYVIIDARKSDFNWMNNAINSSALKEIFEFENINWDKIEKESQSNFMNEVIYLYNEKLTITEISNKLSMCGATVRKYLKSGKRIGLCDYDESKFYFTKKSKEVVQLDRNNYKLKEWKNISEASVSLGWKSSSPIYGCCNGKQLTSGGYKWMYKEDYEKYIEEQNKLS